MVRDVLIFIGAGVRKGIAHFPCQPEVPTAEDDQNPDSEGRAVHVILPVEFIGGFALALMGHEYTP